MNQAAPILPRTGIGIDVHAFAPADDPQVAVAVLVQSSDTSPDEIGGGALGGPIAKSVMEAVINQ